MNKIENIVIDIDDIEDIYNQYNKNELNDDLANYIEKRCSRLMKNKVDITFVTNEELNDIEKNKIKDLVRSHYELEIKYLNIDVKKIKTANTVYLIAGILIIFIEMILKDFFLISTVIDILGWVLIWESVFNLLFTDNELDIKLSRAKKILNSNITFEKK